MQFANLWVLFLFPLFLLLAGRNRRSTDGARTATIVPLDTFEPSWRMRNSGVVLHTLLGLSMLLLTVALARPQKATSYVETEVSARDIMLVLDLSGSMRAIDFYLQGDETDRLTALKAVVKQFVNSRTGDRLGLTIFGDRAFSQCPLTLDHSMMKTFIDRLEVGMVGEGTAIGDGIAIAIKRMKSLAGDSRVIVLVTDGKNNAGSLSPDAAAQLAKTLKIKIHVIGVGGPGVALLPRPNALGLISFVPTPLEYDEAALKKVAAITGGEYFNARSTERLAAVYDQINRLELRRSENYERLDFQELYFWFLVPGALLLLAHELLRSSAFLVLE